MDKFIAELKDCVREVKERPGSDKTEGDMVTIYGLSPLSYLSSGVVILLNDFLQPVEFSSWCTERHGPKN